MISLILLLAALCAPSLVSIHHQVLRGDSYLLFEEDALVWFYRRFINDYTKTRDTHEKRSE